MCLNNRWILRIFLDLFPKTADLVVDAAVEYIGCPTHGQIEKLFSAQDQPGSLDENLQEAKLRCAERNADAVVTRDFLPTHVHTPVPDANYPAVRNHLRRSGTCCATQHRSNAGKKLTGIEWLYQIVIGPKLKTDDPIGVFSHRSQKDDGNISGPSNLPAQGNTILARHHDIEDD
jgi:hypothetical protein